MNALTQELHEPRFSWPAWREHSFALGVAVALHIGLAFVLLNLSHNAPMLPVVSAVITTQLVSLPAPAVQPPPPPVAPPMPAVTAPEPAPMPIPEPVVEMPQVQKADLALKRVQQQQQEKERQQRIERDRQQQRREEALRQEQVVREALQRQARLQEQQVAQARQAEVERQTAAVAAARTEAAAAASRQYLPIAKDAPDYPQRALDRKIEGECTVAYRVNAQGRVEDPQVVGDCHPLFVKPSLAAAKTFRYQPKVVNGQAVAVASVKNTFTYKIQ